MWIMAGFGILMPAERPRKTIAVGDDRTLQIRARRARDLDILRAEYMKGTLGPTLHTPKFDYEYRAYCTKEAFAVAMMQMVLKLNFGGKFKPSVLDNYQDDQLYSCYNKIWSVVMRELSTEDHRQEYWHSVSPPKGKTTTSGINITKPATTVAGTAVEPYTAAYNDDDNTIATVIDADILDPYWYEDTVGDPVLDALYVELDQLRADAAEITDHTNCEHGTSSRSRSRCRRQQRSQLANRMADIYRLIDEHIDQPTPSPL